MAVRKLNVGYYIPMSVIVALVLDNQFETARFLCVKHKASRTRVYALVLYKNAFPIYRFPSRSLHPWASALFRKHCKDTKFLGICIALSKKIIKMTFHKACETTFWAKNSRKVSKNLEVKRKMPIFATTNPARFP